MTPPKSPPEVVSRLDILDAKVTVIRDMAKSGYDMTSVHDKAIQRVIDHLRARYPNGIVWGE